LKSFLSLTLVLAVATAAAGSPQFWQGPAGSTWPPTAPHPAVVRVMSPLADGAAFGSGTLVAVNCNCGLVVTNWHVVRDAAGPILVTFPDGFRSGATVLRADRDWDLAALVVWRPNAAPVTLSADAPRPGDPLTIAGYGSGDYRTASGCCTQYVAPGTNRPFEMVELSAPARNGDSGGPIFNSRGELAGVLFGSASGRTTGSYCGRVRGFLGPIVDDFRRADALWIAQHPPGDSTRQVAVSSGGPISVESGLPQVSGYLPPGGPLPARPFQQPAAPSPVTAAIGSPQPSAGTSLLPPPSVAPAAAPESPQPHGNTRLDQIKTVLAAVGGFLLLFHALRLLGSLGDK
jgi:S1-C subfamily serine protease